MYVLAGIGDVLGGIVGAFFGIIGVAYFIGFIAFSFYAWLKYTHKGMSDIERRGRAMGYGLGWPYFVFKLHSDRQQAPAHRANVEDAKKRILND